MSIRNLSQVGLAALVALAICSLSSSAFAVGLRGTKLLDQTGCSRCCPACDHVCNLNAEQVDEDKTCFDVESKVICIPRVVFPWQTGKCCFPFCKKKKCSSCDACDGRGCSACVNNGARTRKICVLKTVKYKCPKCEYTWSAEKKPCATGCCDSGGCDCAAAPCDASSPVYHEANSAGLTAAKVTELFPALLR